MNDNFSELKDKETTQQTPLSNKNLVTAVVFILAGSGLLIGNVTGYTFKNWWALFMFIPAGYMVMTIWTDYQENGRFTRKGSGAIVSIIILGTMIAIFLFDLSWLIFWPVSLIAAGLGMLLNNQD